MRKALIANTVLMIRPIRFGYNEEAALTNAFQNRIGQLSNRQIQELALLEFDAFVNQLKSAGVEVLVYEDTPEPHTPDSIFPNNWLSACVHSRNLFTYPMNAANRAAERRADIITDIAVQNGFDINRSLEKLEEEKTFLEGTGSLVLDHQNKIAYAALSPRTNPAVLEKWCQLSGFEPFTFKAYGPKGEEIYHTNVLMCMADEFAVIGLDAIDQNDRAKVKTQIESTGKTIIEISFQQMNQYAGNMLQLSNQAGEKLLVMSSQAYHSLNKNQIQQIESQFKNRIIAPPINVIETIGGGSARCMLAEIFH